MRLRVLMEATIRYVTVETCTEIITRKDLLCSPRPVGTGAASQLPSWSLGSLQKCPLMVEFTSAPFRNLLSAFRGRQPACEWM